MAKAFGLVVRKAVGEDCGRFGVPGSGVVHAYYGCVEAPFELRLGERVKFTITGMRILEHPHPMVLLGSDVLCGGRAKPGWNYVGHEFYDNGGGCLRFKSGDDVEECALH